jgi:hypothetical protein
MSMGLRTTCQGMSLDSHLRRNDRLFVDMFYSCPYPPRPQTVTLQFLEVVHAWRL